MFRDVAALLPTDGVPVALVSAGEPRFREAHDGSADAAPATAPSRTRRPLLQRVLRPLTT